MKNDKPFNNSSSIYTDVISETKKANEIIKSIETVEKDMKLLIAHIIGEKKPASGKLKIMLSEKERYELSFSSLRQLHKRRQELKQDLSQLYAEDLYERV